MHQKIRVCLRLFVGAAGFGFAHSALAAPISAGLQQWYDAGVGTFNDTGGTTAASNGATVGLWKDQATAGAQGGAQDGTQSVSTKAATYVTSNPVFNNLPSLHFVTGDTGTTAPDAFLSTPAPLNSSFTIFVVASVPNATQTSTMVSNARPTALTNGQWVFMHENNALRFRSNGVTESTVNHTTINSAYIATAWSPAAGEVDLSLNGGTASVTTGQNTSQFPTGGNLSIGGIDSTANPPRTMNGDIAEILIYNTSLDAADRQTTLNYLASKYNISVAPEPASCGLLGVGLLGLLSRRRRRTH